MEYITPGPAQHVVLCADCGTPITPNSANLCLNCLRNSVDITEGIPKQATVSFCRNCERYLNPPTSWVKAELESRELLAICLRKLKGLNKVRLIDAGFIWTEPHSKRLKVKLTIQKEVFVATILQQIFEIEFVVSHGQCPDCTRLAAKNTWKAMVQVRQKVAHKRTFLFLEQLILKHNAHKDTISIAEKKDGLDFFYAHRAHAIKMTDFLAAVVPIRTKASEQLISVDIHTSTANYKFTYSVELIPICKDDLVCIPLKVARSLSNIGQLTVCSRVGNSIHMVDPSTLQVADVTSPVYWRAPFDSLATVSDMTEFLILDIEPSGPTHGKLVLADAQVSAISGTSFGDADTIYHTRTHLGAILQPGDTAMGYLLSSANFNNDAWESLDATRLPDIVLVKKSYPSRRKRNKERHWKLRSMAKEAGGEDAGATETSGTGRGALGRRGGLDQKRVEADYELFLRDLEEDAEMRSAVNLYRNEKAGGISKRAAKKIKAAQNAMDTDEHAPQLVEAGSEGMEVEDAGEVTESEADGDDDFPDIGLDELLEDMEDLSIQQKEDAA